MLILIMVLKASSSKSLETDTYPKACLSYLAVA